MALFNDKPTQFGFIVGHIAGSGSATGVIGGTMTAGTFDSGGSALITFAPPFISAPIVVAQALSAAATTASIMAVNVTGVTVSNCYIQYYASGGSIDICLFGLQRM